MIEPTDNAPEEPTSQANLIAALFADVDRLEGAPCRTCGRALCGHACVLAIQMGFRTAPLCVDCVARGLAAEPRVFLERALRLLEGRDCYRQAWVRASERERAPDAIRPPCLFGGADGVPVGGTVAAAPTPAPSAAELCWDARDLGCGELALALRLRVQEMASGQVLVLIATDPGAERDIPAWCRLSGHALVDASPPRFRIRKRSDG